MTTATNSDKQVILSAEVDSSNNVRNVRTLRYQSGPPVYHAIVNLTSFIVNFIMRLD